MKDIFKILRETNYYIEYNNNSKKYTSTITVSWLNLIINIKYANGYFTVDHYGIHIPIQKQSAPILAHLILLRLAKELKYPRKYLFYKADDKITNSFYFEIPDLTDKEIENIMSMQYIMEDFYSDAGLTSQHFEMLLQSNLLDLFNDIITMQYGLKMERT
jgi:hypothetical protein